MVWVFPGVEEIFANLCLFVSILIIEDLPTLDLPIKANSGLLAGGHDFKETLLLTNVEEVIIDKINICV